MREGRKTPSILISSSRLAPTESVLTNRITIHIQSDGYAVSCVGSDSHSDESLDTPAPVLVSLLPPVPPPRTNAQSHAGVSGDVADHVSFPFRILAVAILMTQQIMAVSRKHSWNLDRRMLVQSVFLMRKHAMYPINQIRCSLPLVPTQFPAPFLLITPIPPGPRPRPKRTVRCISLVCS